MSFPYTKAARLVCGITSPQKFVLITLAWYADCGRPGDAFPSLPTLARDCEMTARGIRGILRDLERLGLIDVAIGAGEGGTNFYTLRIDRMETAPPEPGSANTYSETKIPPRTPSGSSPPTPIAVDQPAAAQPTDQVFRLEPVETPGPAPPAKRSRTRTRNPKPELPDGWQPNDSNREVGKKEGYDDGEFTWLAAQFVDYCRANDKRYPDPQAAFRNWLRSGKSHRDIADRRRPRGAANGNRRSGADGKIAAAGRIATRLRAQPGEP